MFPLVCRCLFPHSFSCSFFHQSMLRSWRARCAQRCGSSLAKCPAHAWCFLTQARSIPWYPCLAVSSRTLALWLSCLMFAGVSSGRYGGGIIFFRTPSSKPLSRCSLRLVMCHVSAAQRRLCPRQAFMIARRCGSRVGALRICLSLWYLPHVSPILRLISSSVFSSILKMRPKTFMPVFDSSVPGRVSLACVGFVVMYAVLLSLRSRPILARASFVSLSMRAAFCGEGENRRTSSTKSM